MVVLDSGEDVLPPYTGKLLLFIVTSSLDTVHIVAL